MSQIEEIKTLLAFLGPLAGIIGILMNSYLRSREEKGKREFLVRQVATKDYYQPLYGRIAVLQELVSSYPRSLREGQAKVLCKEGYVDLKPEEIVEKYNKAYDGFTKFYTEKKYKGYEIFNSSKLQKALVKFWAKSKRLFEEKERFKDEKIVQVYIESAEEVMDVMEEFFAL